MRQGRNQQGASLRTGENAPALTAGPDYEDPDIGLDWVADSNWCEYLFAYFDRADARLAGKGIDGDEPPKPGVFR
jgi:hypothetical protein